MLIRKMWSTGIPVNVYSPYFPDFHTLQVWTVSSEPFLKLLEYFLLRSDFGPFHFYQFRRRNLPIHVRLELALLDEMFEQKEVRERMIARKKS